MTGFGAAEGAVSGGRIGVEVKTVNHRFFNFSAKLPYDLSGLENDVRERVRREIERGHVSVSVRWLESEVRPATVLTVNVERARAVAEQLRSLQIAAGLGGDVSLELVARQPDVLTHAVPDVTTVTFAELEPIVERAVLECRRLREREGAALVGELRHRLDLIEASASAVEQLAPARLLRERDRLQQAVRELADGVALDPARLAQEVALLADRYEITEELVRLRAHCAAARQALASGKAVGKELGFLAQELGREINTIGSKANDAAIAQQVIAMKGEMEKIREQLENLE